MPRKSIEVKSPETGNVLVRQPNGQFLDEIAGDHWYKVKGTKLTENKLTKVRRPLSDDHRASIMAGMNEPRLRAKSAQVLAVLDRCRRDIVNILR